MVSDANAVRNLRHPRLRRRPDRRRCPRRQRRGRHGDGDLRRRLRPPARGAGGRGDATPRRSTRASAACSRRSCGWACSTTRTSTRTAPARCSPIRPTASVARVAAERSAVLLRNEGGLLPLDADAIGSIAVIGPLADSPRDTLGPWVFDFDLDETVTVLDGIRAQAGDAIRVEHAPRRARGAARVPVDVRHVRRQHPARPRRVRRGRRVRARRRLARGAPTSPSWSSASGRT